ncbi:hypothetical protein XOC_1507 [Xanthomonas oryzae pv. oryzicola BLS256]|uniref:Uncharacterized protein n=1 Tax=Xanthomonas oryzae pv. oryzicola (strain BLS256) TaxID=383407 RepID=G7TJU6_XANOB|nr:hypothetical protein XOC_1507 [Xanthomonas oryzae pv. oryzicola BLS256]QEO98418.1 hypothetical protein XOCgx_3429 [Xanthomonas oryzae pv. oryzicola]
MLAPRWCTECRRCRRAGGVIIATSGHCAAIGWSAHAVHVRIGCGYRLQASRINGSGVGADAAKHKVANSSQVNVDGAEKPERAVLADSEHRLRTSGDERSRSVSRINAHPSQQSR